MFQFNVPVIGTDTESPNGWTCKRQPRNVTANVEESFKLSCDAGKYRYFCRLKMDSNKCDFEPEWNGSVDKYIWKKDDDSCDDEFFNRIHVEGGCTKSGSWSCECGFTVDNVVSPKGKH